MGAKCISIAHHLRFETDTACESSDATMVIFSCLTLTWAKKCVIVFEYQKEGIKKVKGIPQYNSSGNAFHVLINLLEKARKF